MNYINNYVKIFFVWFLFLFISSLNAHSSVLAVLSGASTENRTVCQLVFVDLDNKVMLAEMNCPGLVSTPVGLFEFGSNIIVMAIQDINLANQRNTVLSIYSPITGEFEKDFILPNSYIVTDVNMKQGLLWLEDDDNKFAKLDLKDSKLDLQDASHKENILKSKFKYNKLYHWQNNHFYSFEGIEDLDFGQLPMNALSEDFHFEHKVQQVEDLFDNGKKIALEFYDEGRDRILSVLSKKDSAVLLETEFPEHRTLIGWLNDDHLLFLAIDTKFNNQYELEQVKMILEEFNVETQEVVSKKDFFLDPRKYGGIQEFLLSRDKRYVIIGCTHVGGQEYTSPGLLVIYDRVTNQPAILEFEAGSVSEIIELSEATSHVLKQKRK